VDRAVGHRHAAHKLTSSQGYAHKIADWSIAMGGGTGDTASATKPVGSAGDEGGFGDNGDSLQSTSSYYQYVRCATALALPCSSTVGA
jgi:hypothetical protein